MKNNSIIGGYAGTDCTTYGISSPCFRPYYDLVRGALCKIVVKTFGWQINTNGGPHFVDVPVGSTYYDYIETIYNRPLVDGEHLINGYPCGGPFEPCPGAYFRPQNPIVRGQMAKIISNSANYTDNTVGRTASYYDEPSYETFFKYIERLVMHGVVAPFPVAHLTATPTPTCGSSTQPCFYTYSKAPRSDAVEQTFDAATRQGSSGPAQVFGYRGGADYSGVRAKKYTPDSPLNSGEAIAGPVGVSDVWNRHFVESGPQKSCASSPCSYHPYGSWQGWDYFAQHVDATVNLGPGFLYTYQSFPIPGSAGRWQAQFCSGIGCQYLIETDVTIGDTLPYVASDGEGINLNVHFTISSIEAEALAGTWSYWCYDSFLPPLRTRNGSISSCTNGHTWTLNH
jgi:hypothetical protein